MFRTTFTCWAQKPRIRPPLLALCVAGFFWAACSESPVDPDPAPGLPALNTAEVQDTTPPFSGPPDSLGISLSVVDAVALSANTVSGSGADVLIIWDWPGRGTPTLKGALEAAGHTVTLSTTVEYDYDGTNPSPAGFDVVIHLNGVTSAQSMTSAGRTALLNYVAAGGGFIHMEWNACEVRGCGPGWMPGFEDLTLTVRETGYAGWRTISVVPAEASHPVVAGVSFPFQLLSGFNIGPARSFATDPSTVLATDNRGSAAIVVREWMAGCVVGFHHAGNWLDGTFDHASVQQLFANAVAWAAGCGDDEGPATTSTTAFPNPVQVGGDVDLTANVDDTGLGDSEITSAEYSLDGGAFIGMVASNGSFDEVAEVVEVSFTAPTAAGIYDLCVRGADSSGNVGDPECIMLVVYDPAGGFVTGGGWIYSDAGSYVPDPNAEGKATFGFVSKYEKGATTPTGNTEFQFRAADLNFHSSSYEWLVVTGSNYARFKGSGTINGMGDYRFMLWAGDGGPDTFRIRIWTEDEFGNETDVYDNGFDQALGGGSIVIHAE